MDIMEAMQARHSVRGCTDKPIEGETQEALEKIIFELGSGKGGAVWL